MRTFLWIPVLVLHGCFGAHNQKVALRVFEPSIFGIELLDRYGNQLPDVVSKQDLPATLRVVASGFSPVQKVFLHVLNPDRFYELNPMSDKVYELDLSQPIVDFVNAGRKDGMVLRYEIIASDLERDDTHSAELAILLDSVTASSH